MGDADWVRDRDQDRHLSLDQFLAQYTSEDNASFEDIMRRGEAKRALKRAQLDALSKPPSQRAEAIESAKNLSEAHALVLYEQKTSVASTKVGHSNLFKIPDGLALSTKERQSKVSSEIKETISKNTRFAAPPPMYSGTTQSELTAPTAYERVHTPSTTHGDGVSSRMTGDRIAGTPTLPSNADSKFQMKQTSFREKKLRELTSKYASGSTTPKLSGTKRGATPAGLSAAGQSLLRRVTPSRRATTPNLDFQLRKTYSGTPQGQGKRGGSSTPRLPSTSSSTPRLPPSKGAI